MNEKEYPDTFYRYALSGTAKCKGCDGIIKAGQWAFEFQGNIYHEICSINLANRKDIGVALFD